MTPEELDQLVLEVSKEIYKEGNYETMSLMSGAIEFARRYRKALAEKMEPVAYVAANGSHVELADGIDATPNWTDYYTKPLYSLEDWK